MNERVRAYLDAKKAEKNKEELARRRAIMIEAELYDKVYPQTEEYDDEAYSEWDYEKECACRYEPITVTEEEFREIEKHTVPKEKVSGVGSKIMGYAAAIRWLGIVASAVSGIAIIASDNDMVLMGILTAVAGAVSAWIGSWFIYAFGQLVEDVHILRKKTED